MGNIRTQAKEQREKSLYYSSCQYRGELSALFNEDSENGNMQFNHFTSWQNNMIFFCHINQKQNICALAERANDMDIKTPSIANMILLQNERNEAK